MTTELSLPKPVNIRFIEISRDREDGFKIVDDVFFIFLKCGFDRPLKPMKILSSSLDLPALYTDMKPVRFHIGRLKG